MSIEMNDEYKPADQEIRYLGDVQRLQLEPGDTLVLFVPRNFKHERLVATDAYVKDQVPGHKVLILTDDIRVGVYGPKAS